MDPIGFTKMYVLQALLVVHRFITHAPFTAVDVLMLLIPNPRTALLSRGASERKLHPGNERLEVSNFMEVWLVQMMFLLNVGGSLFER